MPDYPQRRPAPGTETGGGMTEQFGAIPVRAFGDTRLSAADFRVMGAIAYFDRLGRNGAGCYVDPRKLGKLAAVDYSHVGRHTRRLQDFGYLEIGRSATDLRKRVYSLIYNEDRAVVANSGDNPDRGDTVSPPDEGGTEKVASSGDILPEKVAKPNSQAVDPQTKSRPKRLSEAYLRDPAKPRTRASEKRSDDRTVQPNNFARQGDRGGGSGRAQGHMMLPIQGGYQKPTTKQREPDWKGWAAWYMSIYDLTKEQAWLRLSDEIDTVAAERGIGITEAGAILDRQLKKRRKLAA